MPGGSSDQRRLIYFVSSTEAAWGAGLEGVFTDGNAATYGVTEFEDDPGRLSEHVDFQVIDLWIRRNTNEDPDRRRRRA